MENENYLGLVAIVIVACLAAAISVFALHSFTGLARSLLIGAASAAVMFTHDLVAFGQKRQKGDELSLRKWIANRVIRSGIGLIGAAVGLFALVRYAFALDFDIAAAAASGAILGGVTGTMIRILRDASRMSAPVSRT